MRFYLYLQGYPPAGGVHEQYTHPGSDPSQPMSPSCYYPPSSRMYLLYTVLYNNNIWYYIIGYGIISQF